MDRNPIDDKKEWRNRVYAEIGARIRAARKQQSRRQDELATLVETRVAELPVVHGVERGHHRRGELVRGTADTNTTANTDRDTRSSTSASSLRLVQP